LQELGESDKEKIAHSFRIDIDLPSRQIPKGGAEGLVTFSDLLENILKMVTVLNQITTKSNVQICLEDNLM
jgi:hypothetical protein